MTSNIAPVLAGVALSFSATAVEKLSYDYYGTLEDRSFTVDVSAGQYFTVEVQNICDEADISIKAKGVKSGAAAVAFAASSECLAGSTRVIQIPHLSEFGGYVVTIAPVDAALEYVKRNAATNCSVVGAVPPDCKPIKKVNLYVSVSEERKNYNFSGAFTVSDLTSPKFGLAPGGDSGMNTVIVRDSSAENEVSLGFAGQINVFPSPESKFGGSVGLGISESSDLSFFIGPTWRVTDRVFVTVGANWGPVDRLPTGMSVGDTVSDPNTLSDLPSKTDVGAFLSVSFEFLSPAQTFFSKPFATSDD